jgi:uncharacterized protein (TIGR02611 family)
MGAKADEDPAPMGVLDKIRATPTGRLAIKIGIGVLGSLVIALGIILIPFPGPGWGIVILGLAIWAIEFAWAKHLLEVTKRQVKGWTSWIGRQSLPVRGLLGVLGLVFVAGVVWASVRVSFGVDLIEKTREWLS